MLLEQIALNAPEANEVGELVGFQGDSRVRQWADEGVRIATVETNAGECLYLRRDERGITVRKQSDRGHEYVEHCPGGIIVNGNPLTSPIGQKLTDTPQGMVPRIDLEKDVVLAAAIRVAARQTAEAIFRAIDSCVVSKAGLKGRREPPKRSDRKSKLLKRFASALGKNSEAGRPKRSGAAFQQKYAR